MLVVFFKFLEMNGRRRTEGRGRKTDMEGISNIKQGISNDEGKKGVNGYRVNRKSG